MLKQNHEIMIQCLDTADIRLCSSGRHDHPDQRAGEFDLAVGVQQSSLAQRVGSPAIQYHDIRGLTPRQSGGNGLRRVTHRRAARRDQMVTARALECRAELRIDIIKAGRDHHVHIGSKCCLHHHQGGHANHG